MSKESKEFDVDNVTQLNDEYCVQGACNKGPIKIGDIFLVAYQYIVKKSFIEGIHKSENLGRSDIREVKLQVIRIKIFNRDIDELAQGMSGELYLKGERGDILRERDYLGSS
ncbi:hypothetical protein PN499_19050 [Kamptonema animale CS-326]|uniref:hypothetical protein n=1 Tax=Kamptonema animale TaxID=92934 RepID=UPI00232EC70E|nr:hypothetical protein [Kamptonema animale]MDB9513296.1 hypothetical protein [Kamptonema animale CS-326]